jgi:YbbR domain-containing protein
LKGSILRNIFVKDATLKIFSLLLAISLWVFVVGEKKSEFGFTVPVELRNLPSHFVVVGSVPSIDLRIVGPRNMLDGLSPQDLTIPIDLEMVQAGKVTFANLADRIRLPRSVSVSSISPANVTLTLEDLVERRVRIEPVLKGTPEEWFEIDRVTVVPNRATLQIAQSQATKVRTIKTKPIDVSGLAEGYRGKVGLDVTGLSVGKVDPTEVGVEVALNEKEAEREFAKVPVDTINHVDVANAAPSEADVVLKGPARALAGLSRDMVVVVLDLQGMSLGKHTVKAEINLPPTMKLVRIDPERFTVTIAKRN